MSPRGVPKDTQLWITPSSSPLVQARDLLTLKQTLVKVCQLSRSLTTMRFLQRVRMLIFPMIPCEVPCALLDLQNPRSLLHPHKNIIYSKQNHNLWLVGLCGRPVAGNYAYRYLCRRITVKKNSFPRRPFPPVAVLVHQMNTLAM
jgi:hypothetical protein